MPWFKKKSKEEVSDDEYVRSRKEFADSMSADEWNKKGVNSIRSGNFREAYDYFNTALANDPKHAIAWLNLGSLAWLIGDDMQETRTTQFQGNTYVPSELWWNKALSITKDLESFQTTVKKIIDHNKKLSKLDKDKFMFIDEPSSENQVPTRKKELTIAGLDWIKKGDDLVNSGKHKEAIKCYDKAIEMDPNDIHGVGVDALSRKGQVLSNTTSGRGLFVNNYDRYDAIECFKKIIALYPTYTNAWFSLARILEELGIKKNSKEIISCCDAIPETDPLFHHALTTKARVFFELKRHEETFECCDKALGNPTYYTGMIRMPDFALPMDGETSEDANKRLMFVLKLMVYSGKRLKKHDEKIRYKFDWCYEKILYLNPNDYEAQKYIKKRDSG